MGKLVFVNRYAPPDNAATSQLLGDLAFHLAARGHRVQVVTGDQLYNDPGCKLADEEVVGGVKINRIRGTHYGRKSLAGRGVDYSSFYIGARRLLSRTVEAGDIVIAMTDPPLLSVLAAGVAGPRGAMLFNWLQDVFPEIAIELRVPLINGPVGRSLARVRDRSLRAAKFNIVLGERMREHVLHRGIDPERVVLIPNWSDDDIIVPVPHANNPLRVEWNLCDRFVVGYSGNLGRAHEYQTLLEAAQLLKNEPEIVFLFIGDGHHISELKNQVAVLGLSKSFQFRPYHRRADLALSLGVADVHWLSLRPELEALVVPSKFYGIAAAGRPAIAVTAPDGEIARLVSRHECGVQVSPGDSGGLARAILELRNDLPRRERLGANARLVSKSHFAKSASLTAWSQLLELSISEQGNGRQTAPPSVECPVLGDPAK